MAGGRETTRNGLPESRREDEMPGRATTRQGSAGRRMAVMDVRTGMAGQQDGYGRTRQDSRTRAGAGQLCDEREA